MHPQAQHAVRAAKLRPSIGYWAAKRYCEKRGVPQSLYFLAVILEAYDREYKAKAKR